MMGVTSSDNSILACIEREKYGAAPSLDHSDTQSTLIGCWNCHLMWSCRQLRQDLPQETHRFGHFIEAHGHARCHIAFSLHDLFWCQVSVRVAGQVAAQVKGLSACASCQAAQA